MPLEDKKESFINNIKRQAVLFSELKNVAFDEKEMLKKGATDFLGEVVEKEER